MEFSVYFSLCVLTTVLCTTRATLRYDLKHDVFQVAVDNETGRVMVGGNNVVFMLDSNLTLLKNTTLKPCPSGTPRCDVIVNVMEVDRTFQRLLVCGSDSKGQGHCWFLGLKDLKAEEIASFHCGQFGAGLERPVVLQTSWSSAPGPLFSRWIFASAIMYRKPGSAQQTSPVLSVVEIASSGWETLWGPRFAVNTSQPITKHSASFKMELLDGFCHGSECFYLTLQQVNASSSEFISRVASVCAASLFPYVEIPFNLAKDGRSEPSGTTYNRAVAFTLGGIGSVNGTKPVVIAVFGKASPTSETVDTQEGFAIAYIPLARLREWIEKTRMICAKGYPFAKIKTPDWNTGNFSDCVQETFWPWEDRCTHAGKHNSVIQNQLGDHVRYFATVAGDDDIGHVTSVFTHTQPLQGEDKLDDHMTIYVMTSSGRVYMFHSQIDSQTDTLDVTQLPRHVSQREALTSGLRRDLALTARHFFLLSGSQVIARPVDYCTAIASCHECTQGVKGCNWCNTSHTCQLQAKCHNVNSCPPTISKFSPVTAPVSGGGQLTIEGTRLRVVAEPTVSLCGQDCPVLTFNQTSMICTVPPRPQAETFTCDVTINMFQNSTRFFYNQSVTAYNFTYTVPRVENYWPTRLLLSESADVMFVGEDLDTGSNVTVVFTSHNTDIACRVEHRQWAALRCHITNITSQDSSSDNMTYPAHDVARQDQCYDVSFTIDDFTLRSDHMTRFCHCSNPTVSSVDQDWIFAGGAVPVTVRGSNLDLAVVHLLLNVNGTEFDGPTCDVCHGVKNGSCIVCCTPDVTNLTSSSYLGDVKADVTFSMTSKHSQEAVGYHSPPITVSVFRDPEFRFAKLNSTSSCVSVSPGSVLQIEGKHLPPSAAVTVKVGEQTCAETVVAQSSDTIPCDLLPIWPSLNTRPGNTGPGNAGSGNTRPDNTGHGNTRPGYTDPGNTRPGNTGPGKTRPGNTRNGNTTTQAGNEKQEGARRLDEYHVCCAGEGTPERDSESSDGGLSTRVVRVLVGGRVVRVGCVDLRDASTITPDTNKLRALLPVIVGGGVGVVVLVFVVCIVCCVRRQKRKFEKRRKLHAQQSVFSGTHLMQSVSSAGSAENSYVSVERLLNPTGEGKKQREIRDSGLLIPRSKLDLGNVIGQGNFGCVFEGHYQNSEVDSEDWTVVAVKTLLDPATHAIDIKGFIEEALLMKNFDHDHVLSLLGLSDGDRGPMVVLPYMERGDLLTYVKDEHTVMSIGDVLRFSRDIASGMEYLASNKFVHRDLAARNCMLDETLHVKVADFGLCRDVYEKGYYRSDNKKKLPIRWMAMESIESGTYTCKSDVWSLGVVMWEMTTRGTTPYPGVEGWDILRYLVAGRRLDQPFLCPDALFALMERCWKTQPLERPTFRDVVHDVESLTESLQQPAACNALCVTSLVTLPECHRFKDDDAIVQKVAAAMRKMSQGGGNKLSAASPQLSPVSHDSSSSSVFTASPGDAHSKTHGDKAAAAGFTFPAGPQAARCAVTPCVSKASEAIPLTVMSGGGRTKPGGRNTWGGCGEIVSMSAGGSGLRPADIVAGNVSLKPAEVVHGQDDGYFMLEQQDVTSVNSRPGTPSMRSVRQAGHAPTGLDTPGSATPGSATPGSATPGSATPGPVTPGPVTPGPVAPGPVTPGFVTPGPVTPGSVPADPVTPSSTPLISRRRLAAGGDGGGGADSVPSVSFYRRNKLADTAGKDDGYQYFELEREGSIKL